MKVIDKIVEFFENMTAGNNYIWIIVIGVILLIALIGFVADKTNKKKAKGQLAANQPTNVAPASEEAVQQEPVTPIMPQPENINQELQGENEVINNESPVDLMGELGRAVETVTPPLEEQDLTMTPPVVEQPSVEPVETPVMEPIPVIDETEEPVNMNMEEPIDQPNTDDIEML